jgi:hypothetical protein
LNYQDFESAWYLGLIITSFFCVMLTGVVVVLRHARRLATEQGQALAVLMVSASIFTFLFLLGLCLALLIGIVVLAGG